MSKRSKGKFYELQAKKLLLSEGFLVDVKNFSPYASQDFFRLFDILAVGPDTKLIQVKTNASDFYKARKDIKNWITINKIKNLSCEVWLREPRKDWRREVIECHT